MMWSLLPEFLVLLMGLAARRFGLLSPEAAAGLNRLTAHVALPALLLLKIGTSPLLISGVQVLVASAGVVAVAGGALGISALLRFPRHQWGVVAQAAFRGNLAYVALPVILATLGEPGLQRAAITAAILIPLMNVLAVLVLELARGEASGLASWVVRVLVNPLVLAAFAGLALAAAGWSPQAWIGKTLQLLADFALPAALLALGAQLEVQGWRRAPWALVLVVVGKLVILPAAAFVLLRAVAVEALDLKVAVLLLAAPTAVASYPVAVEMGGDRDLAGAAVFLTTLLAFPAYAAWSFLLGLQALPNRFLL